MAHRFHGQRVAVVMGGLSAEREVSLNTGAGVLTALQANGWDAVAIDWAPGMSIARAIEGAAPAAVWNALHGTDGEDGALQGLCQCMRLPITGSGVLASALAMDKLKAKEMFRLHNVPTPPYYVTREEDLADLEEVHGSFGFPVIVKPRGEGSSVGVSKAGSLAELAGAIEAALSHDACVLVERFVAATEVHVGILDGRVLGAIEVVPKSGLYDYHSKYTPGATDYISPPRIPATRARGVMMLAERAARALGCTGACRVDVLVTPGENEYVLEVNTLPGMTPTSLLPKIAAAGGIEYGALCESILEGAQLHAGLKPRKMKERPSHVSVTDLEESEPLRTGTAR